MPIKDPEAQKEYIRKWQQENKEARKEYIRKWQQENKEARKEHQRKYREYNKVAIKDYTRKWVQENKEARKEHWRKYRLKNPEKVNAITAKRRASKLQRTPHWLTEEERWLIKEAYALAKLRENKIGVKHHVDHVVPLQGDIVSGLHVPENLQVIPMSKNCSKNNSWNWDTQE